MIWIFPIVEMIQAGQILLTCARFCCKSCLRQLWWAIPKNKDMKKTEFSFFHQGHVLLTSFEIFVVTYKVVAKTGRHAILFYRKKFPFLKSPILRCCPTPVCLSPPPTEHDGYIPSTSVFRRAPAITGPRLLQLNLWWRTRNIWRILPRPPFQKPCSSFTEVTAVIIQGSKQRRC